MRNYGKVRRASILTCPDDLLTLLFPAFVRPITLQMAMAKFSAIRERVEAKGFLRDHDVGREATRQFGVDNMKVVGGHGMGSE